MAMVQELSYSRSRATGGVKFRPPTLTGKESNTLSKSLTEGRAIILDKQVVSDNNLLLAQQVENVRGGSTKI